MNRAFRPNWYHADYDRKELNSSLDYRDETKWLQPVKISVNCSGVRPKKCGSVRPVGTGFVVLCLSSLGRCKEKLNILSLTNPEIAVEYLGNLYKFRQKTAHESGC